MILRRLGRRQVDGLVDADLAPVPGDEHVAVAGRPATAAPSSRIRRYSVTSRLACASSGRRPADGQAPAYGAVAAARGRSNHMCTCPVPIEFSYSPYRPARRGHRRLAERADHLR